MATYGSWKPADPRTAKRQWSGDSTAPQMEERYKAAGIAGVRGAGAPLKKPPTIDQVPLTPFERRRVGLGEK